MWISKDWLASTPFPKDFMTNLFAPVWQMDICKSWITFYGYLWSLKFWSPIRHACNFFTVYNQGSGTESFFIFTVNIYVYSYHSSYTIEYINQLQSAMGVLWLGAISSVNLMFQAGVVRLLNNGASLGSPGMWLGTCSWWCIIMEHGS